MLTQLVGNNHDKTWKVRRRNSFATWKRDCWAEWSMCIYPQIVISTEHGSPAPQPAQLNPPSNNLKRHLWTKLNIHSWMSELCKDANQNQALFSPEKEPSAKIMYNIPQHWRDQESYNLLFGSKSGPIPCKCEAAACWTSPLLQQEPDSSVSIEELFLVPGTSMAGLEVKKSAGRRWIWWISTGLWFGQ